MDEVVIFLVDELVGALVVLTVVVVSVDVGLVVFVIDSVIVVSPDGEIVLMTFVVPVGL